MGISIIGIGKLGGALALALNAQNFRIDHLAANKNTENVLKIAGISKATILSANEIGQITSEIIFIATQDAEIEDISAKLAENLKNKPVVFHTSGALSSKVLNKLAKFGCPTASFHPLVSVSDPFIGQERFEKAYFCVEGAEKAVKTGKHIAEKLGGHFFSIETEKKILYHAAAVTACGHLVALFDTSLEMLERCGLSRDQSGEILMPLIESTIENLKKQTPENALTGTFARADVDIFRRHLAALQENVSTNATDTYLQLGLRSLELAKKTAPDKNKSGNIDKILKSILLAKKNLK